MGRAKKSAEVEAQVIARGNVVPMMTETESAETVQYVSDEDAAREDRLVSEIRMITEQTKQVVLFNSIEIGRRLTEAKAMVKHGTWGTWLKERVDYSQRTANNFMKIYQEYGRNGLAEKSQALANLSYTQALALIDLPEDERARFAEERQEVPFTLFAWLKLSPITVKSPISLFFFVRFYHLSSKKGHP